MLGLGVVAVVSAWALSGVAMVFVGGSEFGEVEDLLWVFAVLGTVLACCSSRCTPSWRARVVARSCSSGARSWCWSSWA